MPRLIGNLIPAKRVSIDAGLNGTGLAFWNERTWGDLCPPSQVANIYARGGSWDERARKLTEKFRFELQPTTRHCVTVAYIEVPEYMEGTARVNASTVKGDTLKLAMVVGAFMAVCWELSIPILPYEVHEWKGQLPKEIVWKRIKARIPDVVKLNPKSHSIDAIGIGLHAKGFCL
jgi:hypothetical protein